MNNLIDRQVAINMLNDMYHGMISDESMKIYQIINFLNEQPAAQQWTPVSERLPEETGWFLTSVSHKFTNELKTIVRWFSTAHGFEILDTAESVKAWMPRPEPFKEG